MLIIPAVDIRDGKVVRLYKGDFNRQSTYSQDPLSAALQWQELGAQLIHVVDLDGALAGKPKNKDIIIKIIKGLKAGVQVGGGLRDKDSVLEFLEAGAARVVLGSKALSDYSFLDNFKTLIGKRISVSIDAKFMQIRYAKAKAVDIIMNVGDSGWLKSKSMSLTKLLEQFYKRGIRFVNFTNINRDGTLEGADVESIKSVCDFTGRFPDLQLIASGGVASLSDIEKLKNTECLYGVIIGKALYEGKIDFKQALKIIAN
ncbi:MAG: HisA/HisF-related TIM barrel protein [Candidatus Omnitrophota bacterium]